MRYVALLRAINVGSHNRIKMADLKLLIQALPFSSVSTYLQTGNVLFETKLTREKAAATLEEALAEKGLRNASVMVRDRKQLHALIDLDPFAKVDVEPKVQFVSFLRFPSQPVEIGAGKGWEVVASTETEVCWIPSDVSNGLRTGGPAIDPKKNPMTARNWTVVTALAKILES